MLSPRNAFEARLHCLDFLHRQITPLEREEDDEDNDHEVANTFVYRLYSQGLVEKDNGYDDFLKGDDRYKIYFREEEGHGFKHSYWSQDIILTIKESETQQRT
jgi:hypothetical protein